MNAVEDVTVHGIRNRFQNIFGGGDTGIQLRRGDDIDGFIFYRNLVRFGAHDLQPHATARDLRCDCWAKSLLSITDKFFGFRRDIFGVVINLQKDWRRRVDANLWNGCREAHPLSSGATVG